MAVAVPLPVVTSPEVPQMTRGELLALLDSMGASSDDSVLEFFPGSIHYAEEGVAALAKFPGIHPVGVYVKAGS